MTTSPDVSPYLALDIYDRDPYQLVQRALQYMAVYLPNWVPRAANTEVALLEAMGMQVVELVYAINRLPAGILQVLLAAGFQIPQNFGQPCIATVTITLTDTLGHTIPQNTAFVLNVGSPTVPTIQLVTTSTTVVAAGSSTATVNVQATTYTDQANGLASGAVLTILTQLPFLLSATLATSPINGQAPETGTQYVQRASATLQRLVSTLLRPQDFQTFAATQVALGVFRALAINNYVPVGNLLTTNQADLESGTTGWAAGANTTISSSTTLAEHGTHSLLLTPTAAGNVSATTPTGTSGIPVIAGQQYTVAMGVEAGASSTVRQGQVTIFWWQSTGSASAVTASSAGTAVTDAIGSWTQVSATANAPSDAAFMSITVTTLSAGSSSDLHYWDEGQIVVGTSTTWALPVTSNTNQPGNITVAVLGQNGAPVTPTNEAALQVAMAAMSMVNLNVYVMDATVTYVPVTVSIQRLTTFTASQVQSAVTSAIQSYISANTWPWGATLKVAELTRVIDSVLGVDYIVSLSAPASDITLAGGAPLAQYGALSVTIAN